MPTIYTDSIEIAALITSTYWWLQSLWVMFRSWSVWRHKDIRGLNGIRGVAFRRMRRHIVMAIWSTSVLVISFTMASVPDT